MRVRFTDRAVDDLAKAREHYDGIDHELGVAFLVSIDAVVERIRIFPRAAPPVDQAQGVRRARTRRFPFGVTYQVRDEADEAWVLVLRVLHAKQDSDRVLADDAGE